MKLLRKQERELDPSTKADLDLIDAVLTGKGDATPGGLAELALELRADRPVPRDRFLAALGERVAEGFGEVPAETDPVETGDKPSATRPIDWFRVFKGVRRVWMPLAAGAAGVAVVAIAITSSGVVSGGGGSDEAPQVSQAPDSAPQVSQAPNSANSKASPPKESAPIGPTAEPPMEPAPNETGSASDTVRPRKAVKTAEIILGASDSEIEDVADGAAGVAYRYRGFVVSSQVSSGGDGTQAGATIKLRIPSANVQDAVADLSKLGHVIQRTQGTEDVTVRFVSLRAQLTNATKERQALLKQLAAAKGPQQTASIKAQLRTIDDRIANIRGQQKRLNAKVNFSTIGVTVQLDDSAGGGDGKFTPSDALDDVRDILGATLAALLVGLAILGPTALLVGLGWFATRGARRRLRERALDAQDEADAGTDPDAR